MSDTLFDLITEPPGEAVMAPEAAIDVDIPTEYSLLSYGPVFDDDEVIREATTWFRANGFPYRRLPRFVMLQQINRLSKTPSEALLHTSEAYSVADSFHPHRFHATTAAKISPFECFNNDAKLAHALRLRLERGQVIPAGFFGELTLALGTQQCSNFRPGFACALYRRFCKSGDVVLDTSTGYGGRLVGFIASQVPQHYIGIDPNTATHAGNIAMAQALGVSGRVELHNLPAEDVPHSAVAGRCDFAFTSPPYFSKEHYSDEPTQSWRRYGESYVRWLDGFLSPMLALTYSALKTGKVAIINIENVMIGSVLYPLVDDTIIRAKRAGFIHAGTELFEMQPRLGANQEEGVASERVLIFVKQGRT